ncbi:hypothetical protein H6P81_002643 [Aristolochia fimbriata]|uniref:Reverse transcriptase domain-containing protein n=1 Tax=Aristolochia fimbriata TaxID=158543 RepID=A0AAV7FAC1_ARIFI|nr:hypothetical protein H6P81_002643 [Aristolochia fimbriata]
MELPKKNVFQRLGTITESPIRIPISQRLGKVGESSTKRTNTVQEINETTLLIINAPKVIFISPKKDDAKEEEVVVVHHISVGEGNIQPSEEELEEASAIFEEGGEATINELKKVNLGTEEDPRPTFLSASLSMSGLDPTIAVHKLAVKTGVKPVKQTQRWFHFELVPEIEKEVDKLLKANFIREVKYPSWIANIVSVKKKNGQIRVCVDFRDLNKAFPKDDFPLPITELMVHTTTWHEALSFMDRSSSYNQIRMDPKYEEMMAFYTPKGIFCYKVISFGMKNVVAKYKRATQRIFDNFLHKFVKCYIDDLVVKTKARDDHLKDLRAVFKRLQ